MEHGATRCAKEGCLGGFTWLQGGLCEQKQLLDAGAGSTSSSGRGGAGSSGTGGASGSSQGEGTSSGGGSPESSSSEMATSSIASGEPLLQVSGKFRFQVQQTGAVFSCAALLSSVSDAVLLGLANYMEVSLSQVVVEAEGCEGGNSSRNQSRRLQQLFLLAFRFRLVNLTEGQASLRVTKMIRASGSSME